MNFVLEEGREWSKESGYRRRRSRCNPWDVIPVSLLSLWRAGWLVGWLVGELVVGGYSTILAHISLMKDKRNNDAIS